MKLKVTSILLFLLFCIVIAFPGYGANNAARKAKATVYAADETAIPSLLVVLKKCLAKGINMIEEERNTEEEDASHSGGAVFMESATYAFSNLHFSHAILFTDYQQTPYSRVCLTVFTPPDSSISC